MKNCRSVLRRLQNLYDKKQSKFLNQLNRYFQDKNMDWKCVLDRSACTYNEYFFQ